MLAPRVPPALTAAPSAEPTESTISNDSQYSAYLENPHVFAGFAAFSKKKRQIRVRVGAGPAGGACRRGVGPAPPPRAPEFGVFFGFFVLLGGFSKHVIFWKITQGNPPLHKKGGFSSQTKRTDAFARRCKTLLTEMCPPMAFLAFVLSCLQFH